MEAVKKGGDLFMTTFLSTVLAAGSVNLAAPSDFTGLGGITIPQMISWGLRIILIVAGLIFFFMLILGGIKWILSGGDKGATESARSQVTSALIGLVIVFSAWAIAALLGSVFGVNIISNLDIPAIGGGS